MGLRKIPKASAAGLGLLMLSACSLADPDLLPLPEVGPLSQSYILGPGDRIAIHLYNGDEPTGGEAANGAGGRAAAGDSYSISDAGVIGVPLVGEVQASGLTLIQLKDRITASLAQTYIRDPKVSVEVLAYRPFYIFGEVTRPGSYPYVDNLNVLSAVATAGGYTHRANENYVVIQRKINGKPVSGTANSTTAIRPDDIVRVPERFF
jgi:polysaccharide export outer membrane protein